MGSSDKIVKSIEKQEVKASSIEVSDPIEQKVKFETPDSIGAYEGPQPVLKHFHIYHCIDKKSMFTEIKRQPRKYVGSVYAKTLDEALREAQLENDNNYVYKSLNVRSTSIGDLIQDNYGFYIITAKGAFELICLVDETGE